MDASGSAYVTGRGNAGYPTTLGAYQTTFAGADSDAFVTKLNATGSGLVYSTFIGGPGNDLGGGIQVDGVGDAYITGNAGAAGFPTTGGAFQTVFGGGPNGDAYVAKINAAGSVLLYSTFLGGNSEDSGSAIALDSFNNAYVTGFTRSGNYPTTPGALQTIPQGGHDAFVSKVNSSGSALLYSTYIGGISIDTGNAIAVDSSNNAFVAGYTSSANFPVTGGVVQPLLAGAPDAFIIKLNASGSGLVYSTYLGGSGVEGGTGLLGATVDAGGNAYVVGRTNSMNFPTSNAFQAGLGGSFDAFVTKLNPTATAFIYSSYLGGNGDDDARSVALSASGSIYITGSTFSTNFPTTTGSLRTTTAGGGDGYVVKIGDKPVAAAGPDQSVPEGTLVTLDGSGSTGGSLTYQWTQVSGPPVALGAASSAHPTFGAPHVPAAGATLTFQLIVCEGTSSNCSDPDTVNVHVTNINQAPVSQAGPDQTVQEGSTVLLDGTASYDPDIEAIAYTWLQIFGPPVTLANPLTATPSFTAPSVGAGGGQVDFELIVTDPHGLNHSDYVSVFITNVNQVPVANAGPDQTKNEQTLVTLDGSASHDPDLDFLTYSWMQTGGPLVALSTATSINPTFTAPEVSPGGALLTFQLAGC